MAYSISTVALTDTFDTWRQRTNDGITAVNDSTDAATANKLVIRDANGHVSFKNITSANNITISPDTNSGTATVLTVSGTLESSSTTSGSVTIAGGLGVAKNVYIGNSAIITNTASISGNTVVGSAAASDKVTFNSRVATDFDPITNQTYNLGDSSLQWANTHTRRLFVTADASTAATAVHFELSEDTNQGVFVNALMTTADIMTVNAAALTTGKAFTVQHTADTLTSGTLAYIHDSSNDATAREDVFIYQDNASATATTALNVQSVGGGLNANGAVFINHDLTGASNTFVVDTETQTGHGMYVMSDVLTTGITAFLGHSGTNATTTTGTILKVVDDSSQTNARNVAQVIQDHASATAATALLVQADGGGGVKIDDNTTSSSYPSLHIDSEKSTTSAIKLDLAATSVAAGAIDINFEAIQSNIGMSLATTGSNTLTTGTLLALSDTSSSSSTRSVMSITQDHALATGSTALKIQSDAGKGLWIDSNLAAGGASVTIDGSQTTTNTFVMNASTTTGTVFQVTADAVTTGKVIDITADALTTGSAINIDMNSANYLNGKAVSIVQNHATSNAIPLYVRSDSTTASGTDGSARVFQFANSSSVIIEGHPDGEILIPGNLTVSGTTTHTNAKNLSVENNQIYLGAGANTITSTYSSASPAVFTIPLDRDGDHGLSTNDEIVIMSGSANLGCVDGAIVTVTVTSASPDTFTAVIVEDGPGGSGTGALNSTGTGTVDFAKVGAISTLDEGGFILPSTTKRHSLTWDDTTDQWHLTDSLDVSAGGYLIPGAGTATTPTGVAAGAMRYNSTMDATQQIQYYDSGSAWQNISSTAFATAIAVALG